MKVVACTLASLRAKVTLPYERSAEVRTPKVVGFAVVAVMVMATAAFALEQTNGTGKTQSGNSIGYNVKCTEDLTLHSLDGKFACPKGDAVGQLIFQANNTQGITYVDPTYGTLVSIQCGTHSDNTTFKTYVYKRVNETTERTRVTATFCVAKFEDGTEVPAYVKIYFIDKGEPGTADRILFYATLDPLYKRNAELDPNRLVTDTGLIQNGNVQIHTEVDATLASHLVTQSCIVDADGNTVCTS